LPLDAAARAARLEALDDVELRAAVADLLDAHAQAGAFLDSPGPGAVLRAALPDDEQALPDRVGSYRIVSRLGQGGMGAVYEAEQDVPRRRVALKLVRSTLSAPEVGRRLRREAEIQARLSHPGIAQVFEAGVVTLPS